MDDSGCELRIATKVGYELRHQTEYATTSFHQIHIRSIE